MATIPLTTAPDKPEFGSPCNGCGVCCSAEVCGVGKAIYGEAQPAPGPAMRFTAGRFWCGAVAMADDLGPAYGLALRLKLGIGVGCDSADFTKRAAGPRP
jgi:hypothetical protein